MAKDGRRDLPKGVTPRLRTQGGARLPVITEDGTPVCRVRLWNPVLKRRSSGRPRVWTRRRSCWRSSTRPSAAPDDSRPNVCDSLT